MTQNELAFWRDAIIAALHAPGDAIERAELALQAYRYHKADADAYHKSVAVPQSKRELPPPPDESPGLRPTIGG